MGTRWSPGISRSADRLKAGLQQERRFRTLAGLAHLILTAPAGALKPWLVRGTAPGAGFRKIGRVLTFSARTAEKTSWKLQPDHATRP